MGLKRVNKNAIVDSFDACPYCMKPKSETWHACCGEVHTERAHELSNGETLLDSEIELIDERE